MPAALEYTLRSFLREKFNPSDDESCISNIEHVILGENMILNFVVNCSMEAIVFAFDTENLRFELEVIAGPA